jgi:hypothetical protein
MEGSGLNHGAEDSFAFLSKSFCPAPSAEFLVYSFLACRHFNPSQTTAARPMPTLKTGLMGFYR